MYNIFLFLFWVVAGIFTTWIFELILKSNKSLRNKYYRHQDAFMGFHVHHSVYGLLLILFSVVLFITDYENWALYAAFGIGVIIMHTISESRFVFIEKRKNK